MNEKFNIEMSLEELKLFHKILKTFPNSPKQKKMIEELDKLKELRTTRKNPTKRIMYRLRYPDGRIYGVGTDIGSYWNTAQEALKEKKNSGIKSLSIYEYATQFNMFGGEVMIL